MDYEATVRELNKVAKSIDLEGEKISKRILKVMLIHEVVEMKNSVDNITFALYPKSPGQRNLARSTIEKLQKAKVLYYNRISDAYEFRRSETQDFDTRIEDYKRDPANYPGNISQAVESAIPLTRYEIYLEAKGYNAAFNEDKRLKRRLVTPADLLPTEYIDGAKANFFTSLEHQLEAPRGWKESFEGWVLHVLCEKPEDIARTREILAKNDSDRIVVVVPRTTTNWTSLLLEFNAVKEIQDSKEYETFSTQDKSRLTELVTGAIDSLTRSKQAAIGGRNSTWYGKQGKILLDKIANPSDAVDKALEIIYSRRTRLKHINLNLSHSAKYQPNKNVALKDAVSKILSAKVDIEVDSSYSNDKGEMRYLKNALATQGVLRQTRTPEGQIYRYQIETDSSRFSSIFPALADMLNQIEIKEAAKIRVANDIVKKYTAPPYGLGPISLSIFLSIVLKRYGDSVRLKKEETEIGDIKIKDLDVICSLIRGDYPNAVLVYRKITRDERAFLNNLFDVFSTETPQKIGERSVFETYDSIRRWWDSLPTISKSPIYEVKRSSSLPKLLGIFSKISETVPHDFVFGKLQTIYDYDEDELITKSKATDILAKLKSDKRSIDEGFDHVGSKIQNGVKNIFSIEGNTFEDLRRGIREWYNTLDSNQRDLDATWHTDESKTLIRRLGQVLDISDTLLVSIPGDPGFGLGAVKDWTSDRSQDYIHKVEMGKEQVENNRIKVDQPVWKVQSSHKTKIEKSKKGATVSYRLSAKLEVTPPAEDTLVFATSNGEDPQDSKSQRSEIRATKAIDVDGGQKKFRLITRDEEGNWSKEVEINFIDSEKKHEIRIGGGFGKDEIFVQFVFPVDKQSFKTSIRSLVGESLRQQIIDKETMKQILMELLRENKV